MSWFKNLIKSKKVKQVVKNYNADSEEEFRRVIEAFKERIEEANQAPTKTTHPAGTKKPATSKATTIKKPTAKKPTAKKAEPAKKAVAKKPVEKKPTATKKPAPKKK